MIRITQQRAKCIGCNACVEAVSHRWRVSRKDGKCILVDGIEKRGFYRVITGEDEYESNLSAARNCPVKIIQVEKIRKQ